MIDVVLNQAFVRFSFIGRTLLISFTLRTFTFPIPCLLVWWMYGSICSCRLAQSFERKKLDQAERGETIERNRLTERQNGLFQAASTAKYRVAERNICRLSSSYLGLLFFCLFLGSLKNVCLCVLALSKCVPHQVFCFCL